MKNSNYNLASASDVASTTFFQSAHKRAAIAQDDTNSEAGMDEVTGVIAEWMQTTGGVDMLLCTTRKELLMAALYAPTPLAFGIAYGKIVDILRLKKTHPCASHQVVFEAGAISEVERDLQTRVFARAIKLNNEAEQADPEFFEELTYKLSKEDLEVLEDQFSRAPTDFVRGQLVSWRSTHLRTVNHPIHTLVIG